MSEKPDPKGGRVPYSPYKEVIPPPPRNYTLVNSTVFVIIWRFGNHALIIKSAPPPSQPRMESLTPLGHIFWAKIRSRSGNFNAMAIG